MLLTKTPNQRKDLQTLEHLNSPIPSVQSTHFTGLVPISARMCHRTQYRVLSTLYYYYYYYYQKHLYQKLVPKMRILYTLIIRKKKYQNWILLCFFGNFLFFCFSKISNPAGDFYIWYFWYFRYRYRSMIYYIYLVGQRLQLAKKINKNEL